MSSMEEDDWDDWDDADDDIFNEDALITEFGRFLEGLCVNFPEAIESAEPSPARIPSSERLSELGRPVATPPGTPPKLKVPGRKTWNHIAWPGVSEDSSRVLNWLSDKHAKTRQV